MSAVKVKNVLAKAGFKGGSKKNYGLFAQDAAREWVALTYYDPSEGMPPELQQYVAFDLIKFVLGNKGYEFLETENQSALYVRKVTNV